MTEQTEETIRLSAALAQAAKDSAALSGEIALKNEALAAREAGDRPPPSAHRRNGRPRPGGHGPRDSAATATCRSLQFHVLAPRRAAAICQAPTDPFPDF